MIQPLKHIFAVTTNSRSIKYRPYTGSGVRQKENKLHTFPPFSLSLPDILNLVFQSNLGPERSLYRITRCELQSCSFKYSLHISVWRRHHNNVLTPSNTRRVGPERSQTVHMNYVSLRTSGLQRFEYDVDVFVESEVVERSLKEKRFVAFYT